MKNWINSKYLENVNELNKQFTSNKPFEYLSLENFFDESKIKELKMALIKEDYYLEEHDLYKFYRTIDFKNTSNSVVNEFRDFLLSKEFILFVEKITGVDIKTNEIDLHSLKLTNTHYLLCHDDQVQGRRIAFILNLAENWVEKDGGELELFESKNSEPTNVIKSILPKFNTFNIFKVSHKSFHQIAEVISNKERISISGWYYER